MEENSVLVDCLNMELIEIELALNVMANLETAW